MATKRLNNPMTNGAKVFIYHPGLHSKTNNFSFTIKVILYHHSTSPDVLVAKIGLDGLYD